MNLSFEHLPEHWHCLCVTPPSNDWVVHLYRATDTRLVKKKYNTCQRSYSYRKLEWLPQIEIRQIEFWKFYLFFALLLMVNINMAEFIGLFEPRSTIIHMSLSFCVLPQRVPRFGLSTHGVDDSNQVLQTTGL